MAALEISAHLFICRPGWLQDDICIPFSCGSLPRPGRSRCLPPRQGGTAPRLAPARGHARAPAGQALSAAAFTKGQTQAETSKGPGKGRSFPALPKWQRSAAPPERCLAWGNRPAQARTQRLLPLRSGCLCWLLHIADGADPLSTTPSGKLTLH